MSDDDLPSVAAILVAELSVTEARHLLDKSLGARRYLRSDQPPPRGYPAGPLEWLGFALVRIPDQDAVALIPSAVGHAFILAPWLSAALPDQLIVAWRRLRGERAVAKFLAGGVPHWKDGDDPDHEVGWIVPPQPAAEPRLPPLRGLPATAAEASAWLRPIIGRFGDLTDALRVGYIDRRSRLA